MRDICTRVPVAIAAQILGFDPQFVRVAMQQGTLPIGDAFKSGQKYVYIIQISLLSAYCGEDVSDRVAYLMQQKYMRKLRST